MNAGVHGVHVQVRILALSMALLALTACSARDSLLSLRPAILPTLTGLMLSTGTLKPSFAAHVTRYTTMTIDTPSITVTPTAGPGTTITVNGTPVVSGTASNAISLPSGHRAITVAVTSSTGTATYTITAHRLAHEAYIKASNTGAGDLFGFSVALDGDTLAVGAPGEGSNGRGINSDTQTDDSAPAAGAVYVFTRHGDTWQQQAYIKASNTDQGDGFGASLDLDGDTLAVGAFEEASNGRGINSATEADNSAFASGAVYVFTRHSGTWQQQAYIKASNAEANDLFGVSVALDGDTLAVGANGESSNGRGVNSGAEADNSAPGSGAVYVFTRHNGTWQQQTYIKASNAMAGDGFGSRLALDNHTLAVGATLLNVSGAIYLFTQSGGAWYEQTFVKAFNADPNDGFGISMALSGNTLASGATGESSNGRGIDSGAGADNSAHNAGAVYVGCMVRVHSQHQPVTLHPGEERCGR